MIHAPANNAEFALRHAGKENMGLDQAWAGPFDDMRWEEGYLL